MKLNYTEAHLKELLQKEAFDSYVVIVGIHGEETVLHSDNTDMDTYFDSASMGKVLVTSTSILKALGENRLKLSDTLDMFFRDVPPEKAKITVEQLITHTSGIIRTIIPQEIADQGHDAIAKFILSAPLAFEPGTKTIYSCHGFIMLGFILEKVYGERLDAVFEHNLKPALGLTRSKFNIAVDEPNAAACYERRDVGEWRTDDCNVCAMGGVAGSGASFWTGNDVLRFVKAVMNYSPALYPREIFDMAEYDHAPTLASGRGLGYEYVDERFPMTGKLFPKGSIGHHGHTGVSFFLHRESGLYAIMLTNATRFARKRVDFAPIHYNMTYLDYDAVFAVRQSIHNAIYKDLHMQGYIAY